MHIANLYDDDSIVWWQTVIMSSCSDDSINLQYLAVVIISSLIIINDHSRTAHANAAIKLRLLAALSDTSTENLKIVVLNKVD